VSPAVQCSTSSVVVLAALAFMRTAPVAAQQPTAPVPVTQGVLASEAVLRPLPPLFLREEWQRHTPGTAQVPVIETDISTPELEVRVYGTDAKNLLLSGSSDNPANPMNLWTGLTTSPVGATVRNKYSFVDLTGLARIRWVVRTSGFHVVRLVIKLADGTLLVGDYEASSPTAFLLEEVAPAGLRWLRLDPDRAVTKGTWVDKPDLSRVDEVGFVDLMPGSGHGPGGWINVSQFEVYGAEVKR
jgi:hypothetical protein